MSLTAANAVIQLSIPLLFPAPVQLQQFAADDIFETGSITAAEVVMGVDGTMAAGFVFEAVKQGYTLRADSASNAFFDNWYQAQIAIRDAYAAAGTISLPGIGTKWAMFFGFLTGYTPVPAAKRILQSRKFEITWQSVSPAAV